MPWTLLATDHVTLENPITWQKLATRIVTLTPTPVVVPPALWQRLATKTITITPTPEVAPPEGWVKLVTRTIILTPTGVPPVPPEEIPPEEKKKFPWAPILIGGGALVAVIGLASGKKG